MLLLDKIEKIIQSYSPASNSIKSGSQLLPKDIFALSSTYKELNLRVETALLVATD